MKSKKILILFLLIDISVFFISCKSTSFIKSNGDYVDEGFTHTTTVKRTDPLAEFGITEKEWLDSFGEALLYSGYGSGNAYMSLSEIQNNVYEAIKLVGANLNVNYAAIIGKNSDVETSIRKIESHENTYVYRNGSTTRISSPKTEYKTLNKYSFFCYILFFNDEELIPYLREDFGSIQVLTILKS